jgi:6-pyruvoyltetrahydropterin/6-carboxytetrahydropterin synthase
MIVFKQFRFEAAHSLPHLPEGHKCRRPHGHSYFVEVGVEAPVCPENGFVVDYADISSAWQPLYERLDHHDINDVIKPYSTCEYLAMWVYDQLKPTFSGLSYVKVQETPSAGAIYKGE